MQGRHSTTNAEGLLGGSGHHAAQRKAMHKSNRRTSNAKINLHQKDHQGGQVERYLPRINGGGGSTARIKRLFLSLPPPSPPPSLRRYKIAAEFVVVTTGNSAGDDVVARRRAAAALQRRLRRSDNRHISLSVHYSGGFDGGGGSSTFTTSATHATATPATVNDNRRFADIANWAALLCGGELLVFLRPNVQPLRGWLSELLRVYHQDHGPAEINDIIRHELYGENEEGDDMERADDDGGGGGGGGGDSATDGGIRTAKEICRNHHPCIVGSVVLYTTGHVYSSGIEYLDTPDGNQILPQLLSHDLRRADDAENRTRYDDDDRSRGDGRLVQINRPPPRSSSVMLPHHRFRGYSPNDHRLSFAEETERGYTPDYKTNITMVIGNKGGTSEDKKQVLSTPVLGVSRICFLISKEDYFSFGGFHKRFSPGFEDSDLSLRLIQALETDPPPPSPPPPPPPPRSPSHPVPPFASYARAPVVVALRSRVVSGNPEALPELGASSSAAALGIVSPGEAYTLHHDHDCHNAARAAFVDRWHSWLVARALADHRRRLHRQSRASENDFEAAAFATSRHPPPTGIPNSNSGARLSWILHCGGSQGYEAASILTALERLVPTRAIIRRYGDCEHTDTISGMPGSFRDAFDRAAVRRFAGSFLPPMQTEITKEKMMKRIKSSGRKKMPMQPMNTERHEVELGGAHGRTEITGFRADEVAVNHGGAGAVAVYARDWREMARWVPRDASYVVGRYMFEVGATSQMVRLFDSHCFMLSTFVSYYPHRSPSIICADRGVALVALRKKLMLPQQITKAEFLPADWVAHCNTLDEVWVPSEWQRISFVRSGVRASLLHVLPEALDVYQFDPNLFRPKPGQPYHPDGEPTVVDKQIRIQNEENDERDGGESSRRISIHKPLSLLNPWRLSNENGCAVQRFALPSVPLAGTSLDGFLPGDPGRPFVFLSVFKLEDRKGWRELVKAFMLEFESGKKAAAVKPIQKRRFHHKWGETTRRNDNDGSVGGDEDGYRENSLSPVALVLRTYSHHEGSGFSNDKKKVAAKIQRYLTKTIGYHPESSRSWPKIEVREMGEVRSST
jgi:hypothetical protein